MQQQQQKNQNKEKKKGELWAFRKAGQPLLSLLDLGLCEDRTILVPFSSLFAVNVLSTLLFPNLKRREAIRYENPNVNVWQKPLQCYKVISLQLIKINEKKKKIQNFLIPPST